MRIAICETSQVQGEEGWEPDECNLVEKPFCNCKGCDHNKAFKKAKLVYGRNIILVSCNYMDDEFLKTKVDYYLEAAKKALESNEFEKALDCAEKLCEFKILLSKEEQ